VELVEVREIGGEVERLAGFVIYGYHETPPGCDLTGPFGIGHLGSANRSVHEIEWPIGVDAAVAVGVDGHRPPGDDITVHDLAVSLNVPTGGHEDGPCAEGVVGGGERDHDPQIAVGGGGGVGNEYVK